MHVGAARGEQERREGGVDVHDAEEVRRERGAHFGHVDFEGGNRVICGRERPPCQLTSAGRTIAVEATPQRDGTECIVKDENSYFARRC